MWKDSNVVLKTRGMFVFLGAYRAMEGGGGGGLGLCRVTRPPLGLCRGTARNGLCTRMSGTCVTCAACATMTRRRGGGGLGCAVVTWVSSLVPLASGE